MNLEIW